MELTCVQQLQWIMEKRKKKILDNEVLHVNTWIYNSSSNSHNRRNHEMSKAKKTNKSLKPKPFSAYLLQFDVYMSKHWYDKCNTYMYAYKYNLIVIKLEVRPL